jgi:hypothetical protein
MLTIINEFTRLSDASLQGRAQQIHDAIDGNANFAAPEPTLADFLTAINTFGAAVMVARDGSRLAAAIKNDKRQKLLEMLTPLGNYVLFCAKENRVIAQSSTFNIRKHPEPASPLTKPENLRVKSGINPGELQMKVTHMKGAISYLHQVTTDATLAEASWKTIVASTSQALIVNLQPGTKYYCRVGIIGCKKQLVYSDVITRIAV